MRTGARRAALSNCFHLYNPVILAQARTSGRMNHPADIDLPTHPQEKAPADDLSTQSPKTHRVPDTSLSPLWSRGPGLRQDDNLMRTGARRAALSNCFHLYNPVILAKARTSGRMKHPADIDLPTHP
jgi:hypothetical protein